jgi:transposase
VPKPGIRLPPHVVGRIEDALCDPEAIIDKTYLQQLAVNFDTTIQTIYAHRRRIATRRPVARRSGGPRRIITFRIEQAIRHLLAEMPWLYQDEIAEFLLEAFGVTIDRLTISKLLRHINITRKKLAITAIQRNEELRTQWRDDLQQFTANQIVYIDESGSNRRNGDRIMGYTEEGVRVIVSRWLQKKERVSVLPVYTIKGYITSVTFIGSLTGAIFEDFIIEQLLPLCNPFPAPRSVIIIDNASVHYELQDRIIEACRYRNVWIRWLPPYSPDFNPIEESFGDIKAYIRRMYRKEYGKYGDYREYVEWVVRKVGTGAATARRIQGHFRNAGIYRVPDN